MSLLKEINAVTEQGIQDMLNYSSFKFKRAKTLGIYQLDEYDYRVVQAKNAMLAQRMVGDEWILVSIDKPKNKTALEKKLADLRVELFTTEDESRRRELESSIDSVMVQIESIEVTRDEQV